MTERPRVLVAGVGNLFLGDDAFGCEVVRRLAARPLPAGTEVRDFGTRGFDLACALVGGVEAAILVDAVPGMTPGTLRVIEPTVPEAPVASTPHGLDPVQVLGLARLLGPLPRLLLVGCVPGTLDPPPVGRPALSPPVAAAVPRAVALVESLVSRWLRGEAP